MWLIFILVYAMVYHIVKLITVDDQKCFRETFHKYHSFSDHMEWYASTQLNAFGVVLIGIPMFFISTTFKTLNNVVNIFGNTIWLFKLIFFKRSQRNSK